MRSIISSSVLKSDVSERNSSQFSVLVIRKPLQPVLDWRTRTAVTGTLHVLSVYQLLCSCSSSVLFHTNSICESVIVNYNYSTTHKSSLIPIKHRVLIMVQQNLQLNKVHRLDTFIFKKNKMCFILSYFLMFNKILG